MTPQRLTLLAFAVATAFPAMAQSNAEVLRELQALKAKVAELEARRGDLASSVEESTRSRYERLFKFKGDNVVVGVQHGVCGGCHMQLPPQSMVHCQAQQEIVMCSNCGRILYYSRDMDLVVAE